MFCVDSVFFQYEEWNAHDKLLLGYVKTKATPPIFYLPAEHTSKTEALLKETRSAIEGKNNNLLHYCYVTIVYFVGKITERQKEIDSFLSEGKDTKTEDSFQEEVEGGEGDMEIEEKGRVKGEGSGNQDGSDKEQ
jgi:hypothetical protein